MTVTAAQLETVKDAGFQNVEHIADACNRTGCRFWLAVAMIDKESNGRNVYGGDAGGALRGFKGQVTTGSYEVFRWMVDVGIPIKQPDGTHKTVKFGPNGIGPSQITHPDLVNEMKTQGLDIRLPKDNIYFGVRLLYGFWRHARDVLNHTTRPALEYTGRKYNGASAYGVDFANVALDWRAKLGNTDYA